MNVEVLRSTFEALGPRADDFARSFYKRMLGTFPRVRPLFEGIDFDEQRVKLIKSLAVVVALADRGDELEDVLAEMGRRHAGYGVDASMYPYVTYSLLMTLAETFGDDWTEELSTTWEQALELVSRRMIAAQEALAA